MARPKKKKGESRDKLMQIRLQDSEYAAFKRAAETVGLDLSSWVRVKLRYAARKDLKANGL
jgi:hypothetical protein